VLIFDRKLASETPWTRTPWTTDLCTNMNLTFKTNQFKRAKVDELVVSYNPTSCHDRQSF
jgi:hypothetical protein